MNKIEMKEENGNAYIYVDLPQGDSITVDELIKALSKCQNKQAEVYLQTCLGIHTLYGLKTSKEWVEILWYQD